MASNVFGKCKQSFLDRSILSGVDLDTDTLKVLLVDSTGFSSANTNINAWTNRSQVTNEITGTGYAAGGVALATVTVTLSGGTVTFDAADTSWASATFTAAGAIIYKSTGTAANDLLIALIDFGGNQSVSSGTFTIQWNASGIFTLA